MIDFPAIHSDLLDDNVVEDFSEINEIVLDTHILNLNVYGLLLSRTEGDIDLDEDETQYFRLTGILDNYEEQLLAEDQITLEANSGSRAVLTEIYATMGLENPRITAFNIYHSTDKLTYNKVNKLPIEITKDRYENPLWKLKQNGLLIRTKELSGLYTESSCISESNNANSLGTLFTTNPSAGGGAITLEATGTDPYHLKATNISPTETLAMTLFINADNFAGQKLEEGKTYLLNFEIKGESTFPDIPAGRFRFGYATDPDGVYGQLGFGEDVVAETNWFQFSDSFEEKEVELTIPLGGITNKPEDKILAIEFQMQSFVSGDFFELKNFSISVKGEYSMIFDETIETGEEISSEIGYTPTYDMVKGWDFALQFNGRIYYFNPYTDRRWENYVLVSAIHSSGAFQWDMASFANFRELERFDSSKVVAAILLPTTEIMVLKDKSIEILQDDGTVGILREPIPGIGCISRGAAVRLLDTIVFPGVDDIYMFNLSGGVKGILKESIRDIYHAIDNKDKLVAIRDRYNTYRLRVYDDTDDKTERTEFLLTENGWVEEQKFHYPVFYREDFKGKLNFMAPDGKIYGTLYEIDNIGYGRLYSTKYGLRL